MKNTIIKYNIIAFILLFLTVFIACSKDKNKTEATTISDAVELIKAMDDPEKIEELKPELSPPSWTHGVWITKEINQIIPIVERYKFDNETVKHNHSGAGEDIGEEDWLDFTETHLSMAYAGLLLGGATVETKETKKSQSEYEISMTMVLNNIEDTDEDELEDKVEIVTRFVKKDDNTMIVKSIDTSDNESEDDSYMDKIFIREE